MEEAIIREKIRQMYLDANGGVLIGGARAKKAAKPAKKAKPAKLDKPAKKEKPAKKAKQAKPAKRAATRKTKKVPNEWIAYVKNYAKCHKITYKQALKECAKC